MLEPDGKWQPHGSGICFQQMPSAKTGDFLIQYSLEGYCAVIQEKIMKSQSITLKPCWMSKMYSSRISKLLHDVKILTINTVERKKKYEVDIRKSEEKML